MIKNLESYTKFPLNKLILSQVYPSQNILRSPFGKEFDSQTQKPANLFKGEVRNDTLVGRSSQFTIIVLFTNGNDPAPSTWHWDPAQT